MPVKDYYAILGIPRTATDKDIKSAYRRLARKYHPDVNPGDKTAEDRFKEIAEAYEVLSDPAMRQKYDQFGHLGDGWRHVGEGFPGGGGYGPGPGAGGADWQQMFINPEEMRGGGGGAGFDFSDILSNLFGGGAGPQAGHGRHRRPHADRGEDATYEIEITLEEAYHGADRVLTLGVHEPCPTCHGRGVVNGRPCHACHGAGLVERTKTLTVKIPRGVADGAKIRLAGKGGPGQHGGQPGDLYLVPHIQPHPRFERKGDDLYTEVAVTYPEAALGAEVEAPTMEGLVTVRVPAGTSSGQMLRLRGKGMPHLRGEGTGDLYVKARVTVPKDLSPRERELIEELARLRRDNPRG
jgi:DnaJ-class molecular chaperone